MDLTSNLILINGEIKTFQIDSISRNNYGYSVKFTSSEKIYTYTNDKVVWMVNPADLNPINYIICINNVRKINISAIKMFCQGEHRYYTIIYPDGYKHQYSESEIEISTSCLSEDSASKIFAYFNECALINPLGKTPESPESQNILAGIYSRINFVNTASAATIYLRQGKGLVKYAEASPIFPFGCNASQEKAVKAALQNQISIIQGPPGTGKTQTILNIIANLLIARKSILVVSNNNSATENVMEKLAKSGLSYLVASLGKKENKEHFIANQPPLNPELPKWELNDSERRQCLREATESAKSISKVFATQETLALLRQELSEVKTEKIHFEKSHPELYKNTAPRRFVSSKFVTKCWNEVQSLSEKKERTGNFISLTIDYLRKMILRWKCRHMLDKSVKLDDESISETLYDMELSFYNIRTKELTKEIKRLDSELQNTDAPALMKAMTTKSMDALKAILAGRYNTQRKKIESTADLYHNGDSFLRDYPIVLSTTFSARTCFSDRTMFDYVIMDEASQVSVETGFLALSCARNAVIVGDTMQLPNVLTNENIKKLDEVKTRFDIPDCFDCGHNSFLSSMLSAVKNAPETLLREHYRCHPDIINFCNQKFYGGNLIIMTKRDSVETPLTMLKMAEGHHSRNHYNQREIDAIRLELLPTIQDTDDIGIITPYNNQAKQFNEQLPGIEAATVHKFQGREKDTIILSVTDDKISEFTDNPNLLNVAVSRAKKRFCLVVSGNSQQLNGNIHDLQAYIEYQHGTVIKSKLNSIFDYLYTTLHNNRQNNDSISNFDSENLTFELIEKIKHDYPQLSHIKAVCHYPLRSLILDTKDLTDAERCYAANPSTHIDFLIINRVSKEPLLAIETDGYSYHNETTDQHKRDVMKNNILEKYGLPLLRLSTVGHSEEQQIVDALTDRIL